MNILNIQRRNFHFELFEKRSIPFYYQNIAGIPKTFYQFPNPDEYKVNDSTTIINCIPPYIPINDKTLIDSYKSFSKSYRLGFAMDLRSFTSTQEFLRIQLGKKVYKNLRQDIQRLERNHSIRCEFYFGAIDEVTCNSLLKILKGFIQERFKGRTSKHVALNRWAFYEDTVFDMITSKKASLFVMYDENKPIAISLQYHFNNILFVAIISFDSIYYKYSMGRHVFVKLIEWCFKNNYKLLDMGWGAYDYKIKFANAVYKMHTHVLYPKTSLKQKVIAFFVSLFLMSIYYCLILYKRNFKNPEVKFKGRWLNDFVIK